MTRTETATNNSSTEPSSRPSRRKRWVAAASCMGLVAAIAGGGYWSNYVYLSDLTALDAWNRYMDLVKDGKYNDAVRYFPELATLFDGQVQHDFLRDAAHAHAPSKVTFEGRAVPNNSTEKEGIRTEIEGTVRFNDRASDSYSFSSYFEETKRRNGQLGMWKIDVFSYGSMTTSIDTDGLRSIRIGDILVSNPRGSYLLFPGSYRMEATPKNPDYWTINYEHPLADGAGKSAATCGPPPSQLSRARSSPNGSKPKAKPSRHLAAPARQTPRDNAPAEPSHSPLNHWTWSTIHPSLVHWRIRASPS